MDKETSEVLSVFNLEKVRLFRLQSLSHYGSHNNTTVMHSLVSNKRSKGLYGAFQRRVVVAYSLRIAQLEGRTSPRNCGLVDMSCKTQNVRRMQSSVAVLLSVAKHSGINGSRTGDRISARSTSLGLLNDRTCRR